MAFYQFKSKSLIKADISQVWDFVSSPLNLKVITPEYMGFKVTNQIGDQKMYPGMIITYKVSPVLGIKMNWVTEITHVKDFEYFVDEQRIGPYAMWHHEHIFQNTDEGVLMTDIVSYQPPLGFIGAIANKLFIARQLKGIFSYRHKALDKRFGVVEIK